MRSPAALDESDFPLAELSALRLDGEAFPLGDSLVPADQPVDAATRAASLAPAVQRGGLALCLRTAAWVHGATTVLSRPLDLAADLNGGVRAGRLPGRVSEVRFGPGDLLRLRGVLVTSPLRTAFDLARSTPVAPDVETLVPAVLAVVGLSPSTAASAMRALPGAPNKRRAIERVAALGPDGVRVSLSSASVVSRSSVPMVSRS